MIRTIAAVAVSLALAACSSATTTIGFPAADNNNDDAVTRDEFTEFIDDTNVFDKADNDDDDKLSRAEYAEAVDDEYEGEAFFLGMDRDRSGKLSRTEFNHGYFWLFDTDRSGALSEDEFRRAVDGLEVEL